MIIYFLRLPMNFFLMALLLISNTLVFAGDADVLKVSIKQHKSNTYTFQVTVKHDDSGWDHYVNKWQVMTKDQRVLATRALAHPHVNEQPFTRILSGIKIPEGIDSVVIRAYDSVHNYGGKEFIVNLENKNKKLANKKLKNADLKQLLPNNTLVYADNNLTRLYLHNDGKVFDYYQKDEELNSGKWMIENNKLCFDYSGMKLDCYKLKIKNSEYWIGSETVKIQTGDPFKIRQEFN